jgi:peptide methionine sulfoxide reductase MsrB
MNDTQRIRNSLQFKLEQYWHLIIPGVLGVLITLLVFVVLAFQTNGVVAQPLRAVDTDINADITTDTTWDLAGSPYVLKDNITVSDGVTLTIDPGVVVQGDDGKRFEIQGRLDAQGTEGSPIEFTSSADSGPNSWAGLVFNGGTGTLDFVTVRYAGDGNGIGGIGGSNITMINGSDVDIDHGEIMTVAHQYSWENYGIYVGDSTLDLNDTLFQGNGNDTGDYGLYVTGNSTVIVTSNEFTNNTGWAAYVGADNVHYVTSNQFVGNGHNRVLVNTGTLIPDTTLTVQTGLEGYEFVGDVKVPAGGTLTVEPGVKLMGRGGMDFEIYGDLQAVGTQALPIIFTSSVDNKPWSWAGLVFDGGTGTLDYTTVRYAGDGNDIGGIGGSNITMINGSDVEIDHSEIMTVAHQYSWENYGIYVGDSTLDLNDTLLQGNGNDNGDYGLYVTGNSTVTVTSNEFTNNTGWAVYVGANDVHYVTGNQFAGNGQNRVLVDTGTLPPHTTLTVQNGLEGYEFSGDVRVPAGGTLTLDPGVKLMGRGAMDLEIYGDLQAVGTQALPIIFTSSVDDKPWSWAGLVFNGGTGTLDYAKVRYAGNGNDIAGIGGSNITIINGSEVKIDHSEIMTVAHQYGWENYGIFVRDSQLAVSRTLFSGNGNDNGDYGLYVAGDSMITVTASEFKNNTGWAAYVQADDVHYVTHNQFADNGQDRILVEAGTLTPDTTLTVQTGLEGYEFVNDVKVPAGGTLTVDPGVKLMGRGAMDLEIYGDLQAVGTQALPIIFTSSVDNEPWSWAGLVFNGGTGTLDYTTVRYAGNGNDIAGIGGSNITIINGSEVMIDHSEIMTVAHQYGWENYGIFVRDSQLAVTRTLFSGNGNDSEDYGLYITGESKVDIIHSTFAGNLGNGVGIDSGDVYAYFSTFTGNGRDGVFILPNAEDPTFLSFCSSYYDNLGMGINNSLDTIEVEAYRNWWGDPSGPTHESNPGGTGEEISDHVLYDPWIKVYGTCFDIFLPLLLKE